MPLNPPAMPEDLDREFQVWDFQTIETEEAYRQDWAPVEGADTLVMKLAPATTREVTLSAQTDFVISHVGVKAGKPEAKLGQRLKKLASDGEPSKMFHIQGIDPDGLGFLSLYYLEELRSEQDQD